MRDQKNDGCFYLKHPCLIYIYCSLANAEDRWKERLVMNHACSPCYLIMRNIHEVLCRSMWSYCGHLQLQGQCRLVDQFGNCFTHLAFENHANCHFKFHNCRSWDAKVVQDQCAIFFSSLLSDQICFPHHCVNSMHLIMINIFWTHCPTLLSTSFFGVFC